jgi:O-antigen/teichoic acid export membrane protein
LLLVIGATSLGAGLFGYIGAYIVASLVGAISSLLIIHRYLRVRPRANMAKWKTIIGMSLSIGLIQIVNMIYLKVDTVLLSVLDSSAAVGLYGVAYALINTFMTIPSFLMTALIPSMATADEKTIRSMVQKAAQYMIMFACALVVIGYVIRENIVLTVANNDFVGAATPFAILAFATAFSFIYSVFGFASVSLNKHHKIVFVSLVCLVLNVLLNIILIPKYSVAGAAWATVVSEVIALTSVYIIFGRETGIRIDLLSPAIKPVLAAVALLPLSYLFHFVWDTSSAFFNTLAIGAILGGSYLAILFIIRGLPSEIDGLLRKYLLRA